MSSVAVSENPRQTQPFVQIDRARDDSNIKFTQRNPNYKTTAPDQSLTAAVIAMREHQAQESEPNACHGPFRA